jgi:hypothetical protein
MVEERQGRGPQQGARDLLERRQQAQCIRKLVTIPPSFELLYHNSFGVHLSFRRPNAASTSNLCPPKNSSRNRTRRG